MHNCRSFAISAFFPETLKSILLCTTERFLPDLLRSLSSNNYHYKRPGFFYFLGEELISHLSTGITAMSSDITAPEQSLWQGRGNSSHEQSSFTQHMHPREESEETTDLRCYLFVSLDLLPHLVLHGGGHQGH